MTHRSLYIETSVWGMIPRGQPKDLRRVTLQLLRSGRDFLVSDVVLREINDAPPAALAQILDVWRAVSLVTLQADEDCQKLAQFYVDVGIIAPKKKEDGLHVAVCTVQEIDVLVSWNHRHLANLRKTEQYRGANLIKGYSHTPLILTPVEVLDG